MVFRRTDGARRLPVRRRGAWIIRRGLALVLLATNLATAPVAAQDQPPPGGNPSPANPPADMRAVLRDACAVDYRSLCRGVRPGDGRVAACFRDNADRLSRTCREAIGQMLEPPAGQPDSPPPAADTPG